MPRGGLLAIAAGGGAAVLVVLLGVAVLARSCDDAKPASLRPATEGARASVADEGMRAPGTMELRELGCEHALVVDMARLLGDAARFRDGEPRTMVTCDVPPAVEPPTCERAAAVYFGAVDATSDEAVGVRVLREGSSVPACSRLYAPNGADLGVYPRAP